MLGFVDKSDAILFTAYAQIIKHVFNNFRVFFKKVRLVPLKRVAARVENGLKKKVPVPIRHSKNFTHICIKSGTKRNKKDKTVKAIRIATFW